MVLSCLSLLLWSSASPINTVNTVIIRRTLTMIKQKIEKKEIEKYLNRTKKITKKGCKKWMKIDTENDQGLIWLPHLLQLFSTHCFLLFCLTHCWIDFLVFLQVFFHVFFLFSIFVIFIVLFRYLPSFSVSFHGSFVL